MCACAYAKKKKVSTGKKDKGIMIYVIDLEEKTGDMMLLFLVQAEKIVLWQHMYLNINTR